MPKTTDNVCIRCGSKRVSGKSWKEKTPAGIVTHIPNICPNPDCQKVVDSQLAGIKNKRIALEEEKAQRSILSQLTI